MILPAGILTSYAAKRVRSPTDRSRSISPPVPVGGAAGGAGNPGSRRRLRGLIAAIYLDGGFDAASAFVRRFWEPLIGEMEELPRDLKTALHRQARAWRFRRTTRTNDLIMRRSLP